LGVFSAVCSEVAVRFLVEVRNGEFVPEPDPTGLVLPVWSHRRIRGRLQITTEGPVAEPEDELSFLVGGVCFDAVGALLRERHALQPYTDSYGYLRLDLEADTVRVSGDDVPDFRVPARPLLDAAVDCGARYRRWVGRVAVTPDPLRYPNADPMRELGALETELAAAEAGARTELAGATWLR
jgi:hypothetical protein